MLQLYCLTSKYIKRDISRDFIGRYLASQFFKESMIETK